MIMYAYRPIAHRAYICQEAHSSNERIIANYTATQEGANCRGSDKLVAAYICIPTDGMYE